MTEHCILDLKAQAFRCQACHDWQLLSLPLPLAEFVRRADEFNARHHHCKENHAY